MPKITVTEQMETDNAFTYKVSVDGTSHEVTVDKSYCQKLTGGYDDPEELVRQSFVFLLEKEDAKDIMSQFDLKQINSYFPGYESSVKQLLA